MIRLLYPAVCHLCGKVVEGDEVKFCPACQKRLAGKPRQYRTDGEFFDLCLTPFAFEEPLARRLRAMKGREKPAQAAAYARLLRDLIEEQGLTFDLVMGVPMHWRKKWIGGVNHSEEIARRLAGSYRKPCLPLVRKQKRNKRQSSLTQKERKANVHGVYKISRLGARRVPGKTVLVVDDIVTTGSTLEEVARILKMSGAARVLCVTVAKTISE
ncbi:MAG: ComF family protein [Clostridia bacterium]|nr:ComF family protein [Clostridia bacterium]